MRGRNLDLVTQWIVKGDHDLGTAKITYAYIPEFLDTITFHCQQSIEKYIKAFLIFHSKNFKYTHDLVYLIEISLTIDHGFESFIDSLIEIQSYAVEVRYPNETIYLTTEKVENALLVAKSMRDFITKRIGVNIDYNPIIDL